MKILSVILILLVGSVRGAAQTDTVMRHVQEVEVVETRKHHAVTSTSPLYIMERGDMLRLGVTDIADALHRLPGMTLRDYGGAGGMKTVSVRGFGTKHTGVSYDGVMLSDCQGGEIDLSRYSIENVGSLSLVIGDNDDLFIPARQASAPATINILTLSQRGNDDFSPYLTLQAKQGSFDYVSPYIKYEQSINHHFSLSVVGEYVYAENDYPYTIKNVTEKVRAHRNNSRMKAGHGELNFNWQINTSDRLIGKIYYYDNDRQLPGQVRYYSNISHETLRDRNAFGQLMFQKRLTPKLSLKLHGKFNWAASFYDDGMVASQVQDADYWQREYYTSACLLYHMNDVWSFNYSADYAYNNLNSSLPTDTRPFRHSLWQSATAKFRTNRLTVMARLLHSLHLNDAKSGVSADDVKRLSPSISASFLLLPHLHLRASYKEIFRAPTFNENYFFHYGSIDLRPERTEQLNLGVTWEGMWNSADFRVTVDGYHNQVKDMIVAVPFNMFVWNCVNVGKVRVFGGDVKMDAACRLNPQHVLTCSGYYSYQRAQNRSNPSSPFYNMQIAYTPEHSASFSLAWENPWVNIASHLTVVSERWSTNSHLEGTRVDGYYELGASASRRFSLWRGMLELRFDLKNLTDRQYEIVGSYPMPGRSYQFSFTYKF